MAFCTIACLLMCLDPLCPWYAASVYGRIMTSSLAQSTSSSSLYLRCPHVHIMPCAEFVVFACSPQECIAVVGRRRHRLVCLTCHYGQHHCKHVQRFMEVFLILTNTRCGCILLVFGIICHVCFFLILYRQCVSTV